MHDSSHLGDKSTGQGSEFTELELFGDTPHTSPFDAIRREDEDGIEHWMARELMPALEYGADWRNFVDVINKAKTACRKSGHAVEDHFGDATTMVPIGSGARRAVPDFRLSRYACSLIAQNGDPRKKTVAEAQTYFAVQTRKQELAEKASVTPKGESAALVDLGDFRALKQIHEAFGVALAKIEEQAEEIERERMGRMIEAAGRQAAEEEAQALETKAAQADHHRAADGLMTIGDLANKLKAWAKDECNAKVLHQEVWDFCRELGLIMKSKNTVRKNRVTSFALDNGYLREKDSEHEDEKTGRVFTNHTPRVTPKGEGYIWDRATRRIADTGTLKPIKAGAA